MRNRKSALRHICAEILLSCILLSLATALLHGEEDPGQTAKSERAILSAPQSELAVAMREIPVWEVHERVRSSFLESPYCSTNRQAHLGIRYPAVRSSTPAYGQIDRADLGLTHLDSKGNRLGGLFLVLDQSEAGSDHYDLLYFDENADGDLMNDKPRRLLRDVPQGLLVKEGSFARRTWFEPVQVMLGSPGTDRRMIELLPCLWTYGDQPPLVLFVPAKVHTGRLDVDGKFYEAFLGYRYTISASLNEPSSALRLVSQDGRRVNYQGTEQLNAMRFLGDKYYRFSCTPTGDKLFVQPYTGPLGVLEPGTGNREIKGLQMMGVLCTKEFVVGIGYPLDEKGPPQAATRYKIPVGDYYPLRFVSVYPGKLRFTFSNGYYGDGASQMRMAGNPACGIKIREDKPFMLDFSNKPVVSFARPGKNDRLFLGGEVRVEAVLLDPVLGIMIRGLADLTRTEKRPYRTPFVQKPTYDWAPSLDPKVTITRANGAIVAEGVIPFG